VNGRIIFLLEEPSMRALLEELLPRLFPGLLFQCIPHEGKSDLDLSIPRKLRAWRIPGDRFVIVRDNDNGDCLKLKERLQKLCQDALRVDTLIRLVCQELESWLIGDLVALGQAFDQDVATPKNIKRFRLADTIQKPSREVERLIPGFQKVSGARAAGKYLTLEGSTSKSFEVFIAGVMRIAVAMGYNTVRPETEQ
jgi:hypothetical protein